MKLGTCSWCGRETDVFCDNGRCEDCDIDVAYCSICRRDYHSESTCRHIFLDRGLEWSGAGIGEPSQTIKTSFFKLLRMMPPEFAHDLRAAIRSGRFYTWAMMPLIGEGGLLELHGIPVRHGKSMLFEWGYLLMEIGFGDKAEETADDIGGWSACTRDEPRQPTEQPSRG